MIVMLRSRSFDLVNSALEDDEEKNKKVPRLNKGSYGTDLYALEQDRAIVTEPDETSRRRTIRLERDGVESWGFTLQTYGIRNKKTGEVEVMSYVDYIHMDGPAWMSGMRTGDIILSVNGESVEHSTHSELVQRILQCRYEMRLVVLFENCCKKVELHERYLKLKKVLALKLKELRFLEEEERLIKQGVRLSRTDNGHLRNSTGSSISSDWDIYSIVASPTTLNATPSNQFAFREGSTGSSNNGTSITQSRCTEQSERISVGTRDCHSSSSNTSSSVMSDPHWQHNASTDEIFTSSPSIRIGQQGHDDSREDHFNFTGSYSSPRDSRGLDLSGQSDVSTISEASDNGLRRLYNITRCAQRISDAGRCDGILAYDLEELRKKAEEGSMTNLAEDVGTELREVKPSRLIYGGEQLSSSVSTVSSISFGKERMSFFIESDGDESSLHNESASRIVASNLASTVESDGDKHDDNECEGRKTGINQSNQSNVPCIGVPSSLKNNNNNNNKQTSPINVKAGSSQKTRIGFLVKANSCANDNGDGNDNNDDDNQLGNESLIGREDGASTQNTSYASSCRRDTRTSSSSSSSSASGRDRVPTIRNDDDDDHDVRGRGGGGALNCSTFSNNSRRSASIRSEGSTISGYSHSSGVSIPVDSSSSNSSVDSDTNRSRSSTTSSSSNSNSSNNSNNDSHKSSQDSIPHNQSFDSENRGLKVKTTGGTNKSTKSSSGSSSVDERAIFHQPFYPDTSSSGSKRAPTTSSPISLHSKHNTPSAGKRNEDDRLQKPTSKLFGSKSRHHVRRSESAGVAPVLLSYKKDSGVYHVDKKHKSPTSSISTSVRGELEGSKRNNDQKLQKSHSYTEQSKNKKDNINRDTKIKCHVIAESGKSVGGAAKQTNVVSSFKPKDGLRSLSHSSTDSSSSQTTTSAIDGEGVAQLVNKSKSNNNNNENNPNTNNKNNDDSVNDNNDNIYNCFKSDTKLKSHSSNIPVTNYLPSVNTDADTTSTLTNTIRSKSNETQSVSSAHFDDSDTKTHSSSYKNDTSSSLSDYSSHSTNEPSTTSKPNGNTMENADNVDNKINNSATTATTTACIQGATPTPTTYSTVTPTEPKPDAALLSTAPTKNIPTIPHDLSRTVSCASTHNPDLRSGRFMYGILVNNEDHSTRL